MNQELEEASNAMGYGAVKYADLKNQRLTNYKFNFDQMLNLTGNTAVYLLYAHARIAGIIRNSNKDINGALKSQECVTGFMTTKPKSTTCHAHVPIHQLLPE